MTVLSDLKFAARLLRQSPGFTTVALATLALGIAANTIIFSAIDTFVVRPLPLPKPDQLVFIHPAATKTGASMPSTWPDFQEWKEAGAPTFQSIAALQIDTFNLTLGTRAHTVRGSRVNPDFFT
jgi:hypothetical protein